MTKKTAIAKSNKKETQISRKWMEHGRGRKEEQRLRREGSEKLPSPGLLDRILVPGDELGCTHSADTEITWAVVQVDLSQRGTKGLQTFYLEASVPIHPHLQHRHFPVLGAWAAQAASVEGRRHHPKYFFFFFNNYANEQGNWRNGSSTPLGENISVPTIFCITN